MSPVCPAGLPSRRTATAPAPRMRKKKTIEPAKVSARRTLRIETRALGMALAAGSGGGVAGFNVREVVAGTDGKPEYRCWRVRCNSGPGARMGIRTQKRAEKIIACEAAGRYVARLV